MAASVDFDPLVYFSPVRRSSATPPAGRERFVVPSRSEASPSVDGGKLRFPLSSGVGHFQKPLFGDGRKPAGFIAQAERETPFAISHRTVDVTLPRGGKIDQFV